MLKQLILTTILLLPILVSAQDPVTYKTLVGIPGIATGQGDFQGFVNSLYAFSISIAALLAVIKIIIAGVKYMLTDIVTSKGEAKKDIQGALLGLLVVLGAVLILSVINPQLVKIDVKLERVEIPPAVTIASNNLSVEIQPGDSFFSAPNEEACTSVDSSACAEGKQYACYKGEWLAEKNICVVRKKDKVKGGEDIDMWKARVDGVSSIRGTQSGEYGHITKEEVREIPRGAFLGNKDNYDDTGTWDLCNYAGDQNRFYSWDTAVTKIRTCSGYRGGSHGVSGLVQGFGQMDVDIWISTSPGNRGTTVSNCSAAGIGISGDVDWLQPTGLAAYEEKWGSDNSHRKCVLADDAIYYLNIEPNPGCVPPSSSLSPCHIAADLFSK